MQTRELMAKRLAAMPGVQTIRRPISANRAEQFDLRYVRSGPRSECPLFVLPGGPGLASALPYPLLRSEAADLGIDVVMMEHRGVGLSRLDNSGNDLPLSALTIADVIDDMVAVLDDCGVNRAVFYGSSYGTYLVQAFGVQHPDRVAGMVLDSSILTAQDWLVQRAELRRHYWLGEVPETAQAAATLHKLLQQGVVSAEETGSVIQVLHEYGGPRYVQRMLDLLSAGRGLSTWSWLNRLGSQETSHNKNFIMEFDLVGTIAYRELGYAPQPDGQPLDVNLSFIEQAKNFPDYIGEPCDLPTAIPHFSWPIAVISGAWDIRTPRIIAERIVELAPQAVLVPLAKTGHSAMDSHRTAALTVAGAVLAGTQQRLPGLAQRLAELPRRGSGNSAQRLIKARLTLGAIMPF